MKLSGRVQNQIGSFVAKGLELSKTLAINIIAARLLDVEQFGLLNFIISVGAILGVIAEFRVQEISIKRISTGENHNKVISEALALCLLFSAVTVAAICVLAAHTPGVSWLQYLTIYGAIYVLSSLKIFKFALIAQHRNDYIAKSEIAALMVMTLATIIAWKQNFSISHYILIRALDILVSCAICAILFNKRYSFSPHRISSKELKTLSIQCAPLVLSGVAIIFLQKIDHIMIKYFLGNYALGIYSAASTILTVFSIAPMLASQTNAPAMFNSTNTDACKAKRVEYIRDNLKIGAVMSLALLFTSPFLPSLLFGERFTEASTALLLSCLTPIFISLGSTSSQIIIADNKAAIIFTKSLIALTSNIILNLILIPKVGIIGAALATSISLAISNVASNYFIPKYRYIWNLQKNALGLK